MKRSFLNLVAVSGVLLGGSLSACAAEHIRVNVPFTFVLAGLAFQPGQYVVDSSNSGVLSVQGAGRGALVLTTPVETAKSGEATGLRFTTDGHEYRLVGLQVEGEASRAVAVSSNQERKLTLASR